MSGASDSGRSACSDGGSGDDPLFLQVRRPRRPSTSTSSGRARQPSHGARVVAGQRQLQAASDVLLGFAVGAGGRHWYVRQLQDQKASAVVEAMTRTIS